MDGDSVYPQKTGFTGKASHNKSRYLMRYLSIVLRINLIKNVYHDICTVLCFK